MELKDFAKTQLQKDIWTKKYQYNNETFDKWLLRVSGSNNKVKTLIEQKKFMFGGRVSANRGTTQGGIVNCNSIGFVPDSIDGIMDVARMLAKSFQYGAGQGLSMSKIRPKGSVINGKGFTDGVIPFLKMFDNVTSTIKQSGVRRGALLACLDIEHGDAIDFIHCKDDGQSIQNANISVEIHQTFFDKINSGDEDAIFRMNELAKSAWKSGDPGVLYKDSFDNQNLLQCDENYQIESANGCSECPMPAHGSCVLGSINLSEYILNPFTSEASFDFDTFDKDIETAIIGLNEIVTESLDMLPLKEQIEIAEKWRLVGLGFMGLANSLIKLGITYGSNESVNFVSKVSARMLFNSLKTSNKLTKKYGTILNSDKTVLDSDIVKRLFSNDFLNFKEYTELEADIQKNGITNAALLAVAPTGTISTFLGTSGGIEPIYAFKHYRTTKSMHGDVDVTYEVLDPIVEEFYTATNYDRSKPLPEYFIESQSVDPRKKIILTYAAQQFVDQSISNTINLPEKATIEDIKDIYMFANNKLKGITVWRDNCRAGILSTSDVKVDKLTATTQNQFIKRPKELNCDIHLMKLKGESWVVVVGLMNGKPYETITFPYEGVEGIEKIKNPKIVRNGRNAYTIENENVVYKDITSKISTENQASLTRILSLALRHGIEVTHICSQLEKVPSSVTSFSKAVARILSKYTEIQKIDGGCQECGGTIIKESGCEKCQDCGYSKCS